MKLLQKLRHALLGRPQPKVTRLENADAAAMKIDELPSFNLHVAELMRYDPQVRIGLGARNGLLMAAEVEVSGEDARIVRWVQHQWDALWQSAAHQLLRAKLYGFLPFEVMYRQAAGGEFRGLIEVERLVDHPPREARLLMEGDKIVGFSYESRSRLPDGMLVDDGESAGGSRSGSASRTYKDGLIDLFAPQALVCTFDADCGNAYGCALLARAYPAWFEKWMPGGAKRTLRLRMIKDAYIGDIFYSFPPFIEMIVVPRFFLDRNRTLPPSPPLVLTLIRHPAREAYLGFFCSLISGTYTLNKPGVVLPH